MDGVGATRHVIRLAISIFQNTPCVSRLFWVMCPRWLFWGHISDLWRKDQCCVVWTFAPPPSRWRRTTRMSWTSTAACACPSACSWWRRRPASRRRSRPSSGPSCCCTATPTSSATWGAPRWCTRTRRAPTRKSRWAGAPGGGRDAQGCGFCQVHKLVYHMVSNNHERGEQEMRWALGEVKKRNFFSSVWMP